MTDATDAPTPAAADLTVGDFMTGNLCTVDAALSLSDAMQRMELNRIRHLAVTDGETMTGMVSNRDLGLAAAMPGVDPNKTPVSVAVTGLAHTVPIQSPVAEVAAAMEQHRYGSVLVHDGGKPVGIFTTVDALRVLRQLITGKRAERLSPPTHVVDEAEGDARHSSRATAGAGLRTHRAAPSPNDGKFGRGPV
ncbi:MAG: CBS domain-containing protein [Myxococcota bacterium]